MLIKHWIWYELDAIVYLKHILQDLVCLHLITTFGETRRVVKVAEVTLQSYNSKCFSNKIKQDNNTIEYQ